MSQKHLISAFDERSTSFPSCAFPETLFLFAFYSIVSLCSVECYMAPRSHERKMNIGRLKNHRPCQHPQYKKALNNGTCIESAS
jgi:hypothetical protein